MILSQTILHRIWWILSVALSMCLCIYWIYDLWEKWNECPVIISLNHELTSIGTIPLPAMTICPMNKLSLNKFNYTEIYRLMLKLDGENTRNLTNEE